MEAPSGRTGGTRRQLVVDKEATLLAVLRYILPMLGDQDFMDSLFALIGSMTGSEIELGDDIMGILKNLGNNPDNVIAAVTELFVPQEYASKQMSYAFSDAADEAIANGEAGAVINNVTYSEDWTKEQAQYISDRLPDFIDNMMLILGGKDTLKLSELIKSYITGIYTNETLTSLVLMVKDLLGGLGVDLKPILGIVGIDSPPGMRSRKATTGALKTATRTLRRGADQGAHTVHADPRNRSRGSGSGGSRCGEG